MPPSMLMPPTPVLETPRLVLRQLRRLRPGIVHGVEPTEVLVFEIELVRSEKPPSKP